MRARARDDPEDESPLPESRVFPAQPLEGRLGSLQTNPQPVEGEGLAGELTRQRAELQRFRQIIESVNRGLRLEDILNFVYDEFHDLVPYNRISYAAFDPVGARLVARWVRSDDVSRIPESYSQPIAQTTLGELLASGRPRIINDLEAYLARRPYSDSTRQILADGMRSSLTCPLMVEGRGVGFLFFDSRQLDAYSAGHVESFSQIAGVVAVLIERGRMFSELAEQKALIEEQSRLLLQESARRERDLELARTVQRALIPTALPGCSSLRMAMVYEPADEIGGDLLDCIPLGDDGALVYMADAMGHGVPAAMVMTVVRTAFHTALAKQSRDLPPSPAAVLGDVNRTLVELFGRHYVTAACARIDRAARSITLSLAGHPPALVRHGRKARVTPVAARSIPLGINANTRFEEVAMPFEKGDILLLYTDGVTEAAAPDESCYGQAEIEKRLAAWSGSDVTRLLESIREDVRRHTQSSTLDDDITMLAVQARSTD